ncbi:MAG: hypothetical protein AAFX06_26220 [Planctomycetota bacterium]
MNDSRETPKVRATFSLRSLVVLTAAAAFWLWLFRDVTLDDITILSGIVLVAGCLGHFAHVLLPWRPIVPLVVLLTYNVVFLLASFSGSRLTAAAQLEVLWGVLVLPAEVLVHTWNVRGITFCCTIIAVTVLLAPAHLFRTGFPAAMLTAIGIGIWYSTGLMLLAYAA